MFRTKHLTHFFCYAIIHSNSTMNKLAFVIIIIISLYFAQGITYYVSTDGDDNNPGTQLQPFRTVQTGINTAEEGDTVYIKSGTYDLNRYSTTLYKAISLIASLIFLEWIREMIF